MIVNKNEFFRKITMQLGTMPKKNAEIACLKSANLVKNSALNSISSGAKTGRAYKKGSVTRIASAPGEAPANATGALVGSLSARVESQGTVIASASTAYAAMLEFGTQKMAARPYMQPALDKNAAAIKAIFIKQGLIT